MRSSPYGITVPLRGNATINKFRILTLAYAAHGADTGVCQMGFNNPTTLTGTIVTSIYGATTVDTLMNSAFGAPGISTASLSSLERAVATRRSTSNKA